MSADSLITMVVSSEYGLVAVAGAIIVTSFILEDVATIAAATLAAQGTVPVPLALGALITGIAVGDLGLYGLGLLAGRSARLRRWLQRPALSRVGGLLRGNMVQAVLLSRFVPGLRLPTYTGLGLLGASFLRFMVFALIAVSLWSALLVLGTVAIGQAMTDVLGSSAVRWVILPLLATAIVLGPNFIGRVLLRRAKP